MGSSVSGRPFHKAPGGKTRLLPELLSRLPAGWTGSYFEPFLGGGALFFALREAGHLGDVSRGITLNDANAALVCAWASVRDHVEELIAELEEIQRWHHKDPEHVYYELRDEANAQMTTPGTEGRMLRLGALFLYLTRAGFNGLWRVNKAGKHNVPIGKYDHATLDLVRADHLRVAHDWLDETEIRHGDFEVAVQHAKAGDLVYADPPYAPVSATADFTAYTAGGFGWADQERLERVARELAERGVYVMLSNADTPSVRFLYNRRPWRGHTIEAARAINSKGDRRGKVGEVVITSYEVIPREDDLANPSGTSQRRRHGIISAEDGAAPRAGRGAQKERSQP